MVMIVAMLLMAVVMVVENGWFDNQHDADGSKGNAGADFDPPLHVAGNNLRDSTKACTQSDTGHRSSGEKGEGEYAHLSAAFFAHHKGCQYQPGVATGVDAMNKAKHQT